MPREELEILKNHGATSDLVNLDLTKCPDHLLENVIRAVQEHVRRLRNNCGETYKGIQHVRENISRAASAVRQILKN